MACIVEKPERITFIHNPRAAGTSIKRWMIRNSTAKYLFPAHATPNFLQSELGWKFCVVRNPVTHVFSGYKFLYNRTKIIIEYLKDDLSIMQPEVEISLSDNHNLEVQLKKLDNYEKGFVTWAKEHRYHDQLKYVNACNYVIKFENLNEDFKVVQEKLDCFRDLPHLNIGKDLGFEINEEAINVIKERYVKQAQLLGYIL